MDSIALDKEAETSRARSVKAVKSKVTIDDFVTPMEAA